MTEYLVVDNERLTQIKALAAESYPIDMDRGEKDRQRMAKYEALISSWELKAIKCKP